MTLCKKYKHGRQRTEWGGCWQHHPKNHPSVECPEAFAQTYDEGVWKLLGDAWLALLLPCGFSLSRHGVWLRFSGAANV